MRSRVFLLLAGLLVLQGPSFAARAPDYIRYAEDAASARLEVAIRTMTLPSGQRVDLIGVVHIADLAYYQDLNARFATYDSVLFELVGDPRALTSRPADAQRRGGGSTLGVIQQAASDHLGLTFQLHAIDYSRDNMVHADLSAEAFASLQAERGETTMTMFANAMKAQMRGQVNHAATSEFDVFGLIRILVSPDSRAAFKKALAKTFDQAEAMSVAMEGPGGTAILSGRNAVAVGKIREVLADRRQRRIAVFYGAAHMPGIQASLVKDLNARATGEEWLAAWTMPEDPPAPGPSPFASK